MIFRTLEGLKPRATSTVRTERCCVTVWSGRLPKVLLANSSTSASVKPISTREFSISSRPVRRCPAVGSELWSFIEQRFLKRKTFGCLSRSIR
uniref:Uncharacterized protein n=1 Tax=Anguilla anguilla TaxID=7936 RepID=A0A0E9RBM9_ANGAN